MKRSLAAAVALVTVTACSAGQDPALVDDAAAAAQCDGFAPDLDAPFAGIIGPWVDADPISLPTATPADVGLDAAALDAAAAAVALSPIAASLLVLRQGKLAYERYFNGFGPADANNVHSLSKSILSVLTGIAVADGALALDTTVGEALPPALVPANGDLTVADLLTMSGGLAVPLPDYDYEWEYDEFPDGRPTLVRSVLASERVAEAGSEFAYGTGLTQVLGAVVSEATGMSLCEFAARRLFGPLGIDVEAWHVDPAGYFAGGHSLALTPREIARFGLLVAAGGEVDGQRLVAADWLEGSLTQRWPLECARAVPVAQGYGSLWWRYDVGGHEVWLASGYGAQDLAVVPDLDLLAVITHVTTSGVGMRVSMPALLYDLLLVAVDGTEQPEPSEDCRSALFEAAIVAADGTTAAMPIAGWPEGVVPFAGSPTGDRLVASRQFAGAWDVWVVNPDGTGLSRLTGDAPPDTTPSWSPDGALVAFARGDPDAADLYVVTPDGDAMRALTALAGFEHSPAWSPDGARLAFVHGTGATSGFGTPGDLWVVGADGTGAELIHRGPAANPAWSPDGRRLAYEAVGDPNHVVLLDLADGTTADLGPGYLPRWSPSGNRLAIIAAVADGAADLVVLKPDGSNRTTLAGDGAFNTAPLWLDETTIFFSRRSPG